MLSTVRTLAALLLFSAPLMFGQSAVNPGGSVLIPGPGGSGGAVTSVNGQTGAVVISTTPGVTQTISGLTFSPSEGSIAASWTTLKTSDSQMTCGGKTAVDNGVETSVTFHRGIVYGLTAGTVYSCTVTSGATTSSAQNVTTLAAVTRTPISTVAFTHTASTTPTGDTFYNFVSNDNITYITEDDGNGFAAAPGPSENMQIARLTSESTLVGSPVNLLTNYGFNGQLFGTAGPGGTGLAHKFSGLFGMGGVLFGFESANNYAQPQLQLFGNIITSKDHGGSWSNFSNPNAVSPNGIPLNPVGTFEFGLSSFGWCNAVRYATDDGSNGYTTPGNRIDGADAYVYGSCTDGQWDNSSHLYMWRIPRAQMLAQNPAALQYWSGTTPSVSAFINDSNWTSSAASAVAIYTAVNQTSAQDEVFVPGLNYYLLLTWYHPTATVSSNTVWVISAGPTPAGPWTQVLTQTNNPSGWYNPTVLHRTVATNVATSNIPLTLVYGGDYGAGSATYYHPSYGTMTLNPAALIDATASATFAGSVAHSLRSAYAGPLVRIQRASDSTQTDVGQTGGLLTQATVTTFCAGTTCNVTKLYDQSGLAHDCAQTTFANMPVIYTGGAIQLQNSKPTMVWDNTSRWLNCPISLTGTTYEALSVAALNSAAGTFAGLVILNDGVNSGGSSANSLGMIGRSGLGQQVAISSLSAGGGVAVNITYGQQFLADATANTGSGGGIGIGIDGAALGTSGMPSPAPLASTQITIGSDIPTSTYFWFGTVSDVVVYPTQLSGSQRTAAHSIEAGFFGTP